MSFIFILGLSVLSLWLFSRLWESERIIRNLSKAVETKRRFLLRDTRKLGRSQNLDQLVVSTNALIDAYAQDSTKTSYFSDQVEATLGSIQEAIFILNEEHTIHYSNESAEQIFNAGKPMKGLRLESLVRSPSLLEFLSVFKRGGRGQKETISIEHQGKDLWFEASGSFIESTQLQNGSALLLVLHEITRLKQLEMMRRDFIANVSHELRTPITIIKGFSETMVDDYDSLSDEAKVRFFSKIRNNVERLHLLVEDLLTLSRLESQPDRMEFSLQSLHKRLLEVEESYVRRLDSSRQKIFIEFDPLIEPFVFDPDRIQQVLDNLVENVFRYAPEFTELKLSARLSEKKDYVLCSVSDNGPGIPEKSLPHLFERFYRVDKGRSKEKGGTGLGLSITKHIILAHGGQVRAKSVFGQGCEIIFSLPYIKILNE
ncbi:MAG: hypothetical protein CML12_01200 [Puniceicoccaceae bacterium]|nr:hypothetical protein [Puniceicoccaceae bacterium]